MGIPERDLDEITIKLRDPDRQLVKMITFIRALANPGHSFIVKVDPDSKESMKTFSMDGDGSFSVRDIWFNGVHVEKLENNDLILKEYLKKIQK
jgi:hypothetical protein